jgi:hypothetical protein
MQERALYVQVMAPVEDIHRGQVGNQPDNGKNEHYGRTGFTAGRNNTRQFSLRKRYNLLMLAIRTSDAIIISLLGETRLEAGDIAIIYASPEDIAKGARLFIHLDRSRYHGLSCNSLPVPYPFSSFQS